MAPIKTNNPVASYFNRFSKTGKDAVSPAPIPFSASGGNVNGLAPGNGYKYHTFTSPGTFTVTGSKTMEVLMVAGGGTGGSDGGGGGCGGGGGGGLLFGPLNLTAGSFPIIVGATTADAEGTNGNETTAFGATAVGGGHGGLAGGNNAESGGSGGGGCAGSPGYAGKPGTQAPQPLPYGTLTGYGNQGGTGTSDSNRDGGGGGGSGGNGSNGGAGGIGRQYPTFTGPLIGVPALNPLSGYYAGGGGGGRSGPSASPDGSGGSGSPGTSDNGSDGVTNSGGGGGGASKYPNPGSAGGTGASGIVCVRYAV